MLNHVRHLIKDDLKYTEWYSFDLVSITAVVGATTGTTTVTKGSTTTKQTTTAPGCTLSQWSPWSTCTPECQSSRYQQRTRSVVSGNNCPDSLKDNKLCDQSACEQCTITRESYVKQLQSTPPSDGEFNHLSFRFNYEHFFSRFRGILYQFDVNY